MPTPKPPLWTFEQARALIVELQPILWPLQWHITLGGGVLNTGSSMKDLDLYLLPVYREQPASVEAAGAVINKHFRMERDVASTLDGLPVHECFAVSGEYRYQGKRVDIFIVRP